MEAHAELSLTTDFSKWSNRELIEALKDHIESNQRLTRMIKEQQERAKAV